MLPKTLKILAIAPHTDDLELACGGSICRWTNMNCKVHCVAFSDCHDTLADTPFKPETLGKESISALRNLGVTKSQIVIFNQTNKHFYRESRDIFDKLEELKKQLNPDLVLIPSLRDTHQDHLIVAQQALHVFRRDTSIMSYEQPWNNLTFAPNFFITLNESQIQKKIQSLTLFKTQAHLNRSYFDSGFIRGLARVRGTQALTQYAEAFEIIKLIDR